MRLTLLLILLSLYSCKKDYNCSCDIYSQGQYASTQVEVIKDTKYAAKKTCQSKNSKSQFGVAGYSIDLESRCELK